jgi:hypothetical protein
MKESGICEGIIEMIFIKIIAATKIEFDPCLSYHTAIDKINKNGI